MVKIRQPRLFPCLCWTGVWSKLHNLPLSSTKLAFWRVDEPPSGSRPNGEKKVRTIGARGKEDAVGSVEGDRRCMRRRGRAHERGRLARPLRRCWFLVLTVLLCCLADSCACLLLQKTTYSLEGMCTSMTVLATWLAPHTLDKKIASMKLLSVRLHDSACEKISSPTHWTMKPPWSLHSFHATSCFVQGLVPLSCQEPCVFSCTKHRHWSAVHREWGQACEARYRREAGLLLLHRGQLLLGCFQFQAQPLIFFLVCLVRIVCRLNHLSRRPKTPSQLSLLAWPLVGSNEHMLMRCLTGSITYTYVHLRLVGLSFYGFPIWLVHVITVQGPCRAMSLRNSVGMHCSKWQADATLLWQLASCNTLHR